ncbi:caspase family protein [Marivirga sp.]|uniref:caspase family protein n=1 Tax=Marivirga sp. TaxID=2018662 RepID=UPI003DA72D6B
MKNLKRLKYVLFPILVLFYSGCLLGQGVSTKTAAIKIEPSAIAGDKMVMPSISWINPNLEYTNSTENKVVFKAKVKSSDGLQSVSMEAYAKKNNAKLGSKQYTIEPGQNEMNLEEELFLPDGEIIFKVTAVSISGGTISSKRSILVGMDAVKDAVAIDRKDYALVFATDKYDNWSDLVNPVNDGKTIAEQLKKLYGFQVEVVENPTQNEVFEKILEYNRKSYKPQDQLMIFFAGHGQFDEDFGEGYVVAKNSLANDKSKTSYISHARLRSVINNIPCEHIFLAMDVCFGGTFDPRIAANRGLQSFEQDDKEMLARKLSYKTRRYLTSGGKEYVSDGIPGEHSPFARKVLEALKDLGGSDRILTLTELYTYLERLKPAPRSGTFGDNEALSDFVFVGQEF